jgi:short-subunit dehydrogenase
LKVLVTGSTRGLGRALVCAFARAGHSVVLHGRSESALSHVAAEVDDLNALAVIGRVQGDVCDPGTWNRIAVAAAQADLDCLVNNAGDYEGPADRIIQTNLIAPIKIICAVYPHFQLRGRGMIVNINSLAAKGYNDAEAVYTASKWGLRGFSGSFKYGARRDNVSVLDVYLGAMRTDMTEERPGREKMIEPEEAAARIVGECSRGRSLLVNEIEIGRITG